MVPPAIIGLALVLALLVLPPARRLQLAELDSRWIGGYAGALWVGAMLAALGARFLLPILLVTWVAPFVVAPERLGRAFRRGPRHGRGVFVRDVTPTRPGHERRPPDAS